MNKMEGNKEGDERVVLTHEAKSNSVWGLFGIELNDGKRIMIFAEENTLLRDTQYFLIPTHLIGIMMGILRIGAV